MHIKGRDLDKKHKIGSKSDAYLLISRYSGNLKVQIYKSGIYCSCTSNLFLL